LEAIKIMAQTGLDVANAIDAHNRAIATCIKTLNATYITPTRKRLEGTIELVCGKQ
jgi:hypothetical protein